MKSPVQIEQAAKQYDRGRVSNRRDQAEKERQALVQRFPIEQWPSLTLEQYALGQDNSEDMFCRWLEFRTPTIGSMKGGSATPVKLLLLSRLERRPTSSLVLSSDIAFLFPGTLRGCARWRHGSFP